MLLPGDIKRYIQGQVTANGTSEVTITVPNIEATSVVVVSLNTVGGTPAGAPYVSTKNVSTNTIGIKAAAGDTSVYDVLVFV
jgi:hypothetical protein